MTELPVKQSAKESVRREKYAEKRPSPWRVGSCRTTTKGTKSNGRRGVYVGGALQTGFTLIELVIALAIFALAAGALALALARLSERARRTSTNQKRQEQSGEVARQLARDLAAVYNRNGWQRPINYGPQPLLLLQPSSGQCTVNATVAQDGTGTNAVYCGTGGWQTLEATVEFDPAATGSVGFRPTASHQAQVCLLLRPTSYDQTLSSYGVCVNLANGSLTAINDGASSPLAASFQAGAQLALELDFAPPATRTVRLVMRSTNGAVQLATLQALRLTGQNARPVVQIQSSAQNSIQMDAALAQGGPLRPLIMDLLPGQSQILDTQNQPVNSLTGELNATTNPQWTLLLPDSNQTTAYVRTAQIPSADQLQMELTTAPLWTSGSLVTLADPAGTISLWIVQNVQNQQVTLVRGRVAQPSCPVRDAGPPVTVPPPVGSALTRVQCVLYTLDGQGRLSRTDAKGTSLLASEIARIALQQIDGGTQTLQAKTLTSLRYAPSTKWQVAITPRDADSPFLLPLELPNVAIPNRDPFTGF